MNTTWSERLQWLQDAISNTHPDHAMPGHELLIALEKILQHARATAAWVQDAPRQD